MVGLRTVRHSPKLWILATAFYLVADIALTAVALSLGYQEANTVMLPVLDHAGVVGLLLVKLALFCVMVGVSELATKRSPGAYETYGSAFPASVVVIGVAVVGWNLSQLLTYGMSPL